MQEEMQEKKTLLCYDVHKAEKMVLKLHLFTRSSFFSLGFRVCCVSVMEKLQKPSLEETISGVLSQLSRMFCDPSIHPNLLLSAHFLAM